MIRIIPWGSVPMEEILTRRDLSKDVSASVAEILRTVRAQGDAALLDYARRFDRVSVERLEVPRAAWDRAAEQLDPQLMRVIRRAAENVRSFHQNQVRSGFVCTGTGTVMGQRVVPLDRVGIYVPGGTAALPSTVLMDCIPAKLAGCKEVIMTTPPGKDGQVAPAVLAAAAVAGVDRVFCVGGAQAIAALAYGTETVPRVDKIVGPGNAWVAEAKRQVFGQVAIDMIAGPSEILILADGNTDPAQAAADLLSQAEHDVLASAVLITDSESLARAVQDQVEHQLDALPRRDIAQASIDENGRILCVPDLSVGIEIANALAPEHLELCVDDPFALLPAVRSAGSVFLGRSCPEALGDYLAGPNHTLPTGGTARFSSPLSVDDFVKKIQFTYFTPAALQDVAEDVARFARAEGLEAHAHSALIRGEARS